MNTKDRLKKFLSKKPSYPDSAYIAESAILVGDVTLGEFSSVWYNCVLRADINFIKIGEFSNIQDSVVGHLSNDFPLIVGDFVTIGHGAVIHACEIEDECLIGMNATVLDGAAIGKNSIIAAGTVVPSGMSIPAGSLVAGVPGKIKKSLSENKRKSIKGWAEKYIEVAKAHKLNG